MRSPTFLLVTALIVASVALVLLIVLGVALLWQERRGDPDPTVVYGVEDSIEWVIAGLSPESKQGLRRSDVRRILEFAVHYLQTPSVRSDPEAPAIVASAECAQYVQDRSLAQGYSYDGPLILEILDLQASYLHALGAVGDLADDGEGEDTEVS